MRFDSRSRRQLFIAIGAAVIADPMSAQLQEMLDANQELAVAEETILEAEREGVLPLLANVVRKKKWRCSKLLLDLDQVWHHVTRAQFGAFESVAIKLNQLAIKTVLLKGADLFISAYPSDVPRCMGDIDALVLPTEVSSAAAIMSDCGFVQSVRLNIPNLQVEPLSDADRMGWEHSKQELPPAFRIVRVPELDEFAEVIGTYVDATRRNEMFAIVDGEVFLAAKIGMHHNIAPEILLSDIWTHLRKLTLPCQCQMYGLSPNTLAWYLPSKFYHEFMLFDKAGRVRQFIDILAVIGRFHHEIDWENVLEHVVRYNLEPSIYYVLSHVNRIVANTVPTGFLEAVNPGESQCGRLHDWGDFVSRLCDRRPLLDNLF